MKTLHLRPLYGLVAVCLLAGCASKPEPLVDNDPLMRSFSERIENPDMRPDNWAHENGSSISGATIAGKKYEGSTVTIASKKFLGGSTSPYGDDQFSAGSSHYAGTEANTKKTFKTQEALLGSGERVIPNVEASPVNEKTYETQAAVDASRSYGAGTRQVDSQEAVVRGASQEDLDARSPQAAPVSVDDVREILNRNR